jgi:hypothetical protein
MVRGRKKVGAWDLMQELQSDPEWVRQNADREAKQAAAEAQFRVEEDPIIVDLAKVGLEVGSVWDLVNSSASYSEAIVVLLDHLRRPYHSRIRNGIIRALTTPEARSVAGQDVLRELGHEKDSENRWALANALTVVADRDDADQIRRLADDPAYEDIHERLEEALKKLRTSSNSGSGAEAR